MWQLLRRAFSGAFYIAFCAAIGSCASEGYVSKPTVSAAIKLKQVPARGEYVALSLNAARARAERARGEFSRTDPDAFYLAGINLIHGLVYDRDHHDLILVGEYDPNRATLTLDDLAVAMRARMVYGRWPLVSIDPTGDTQAPQLQRVRFEGGIENTQFGHDLFEADYRLKQIAMGLKPSGVPGLQTYWDRAMEGGDSHKISSRFWFYPVLPSVSIRENVIAIKGLKVGVFSEVMSAEIDGKRIENIAEFREPASADFARAVSARFSDIARIHASFARVQGLDELVAIAKAVEELEPRPTIAYWLRDYKIEEVPTPTVVEVLTRSGKYKRPGDSRERVLSLSGGVQLMAVALRLRSGDVSALRDAVLKTRPTPDSLSWTFVVGEWIVPTSSALMDEDDLAVLLAQADFLERQQHYDSAIALYSKIVQLRPTWIGALVNRGNAYAVGKKEFQRAIDDFSRALEIDPLAAELFQNRGNAYAKGSGDYHRAIADFSRAIALNPELAESYQSRAASYSQLGGNFLTKAIEDFDRVIKINPKRAIAYVGRGLVYSALGERAKALGDLNLAIEISPALPAGYAGRGTHYYRINEPHLAIADCTRAIALDVKFAEAFGIRGISRDSIGDYAGAIADFTRQIDLEPTYVAYYNRAVTLGRGRRDFVRAIEDFNRAIEMNSQHSSSYNNRGMAYFGMRDFERAVSDYSRAIAIDPQLWSAHYNMALAYEEMADRKSEALAAYKSFLEIAPPQLISQAQRARQRISALSR